MEAANRVLQVQGLHKKFKDFQIDNVSFSLEAGYIMGFIGRNGSGKTSIMKLIQNVLVKTSGTVTVCGYDNRKQEIQAKNEIGFIADSCPFMKRYTLFENAELFGKYYTNFDMELFKNYLKRFGLDGYKNVLDLSKGMESRFQLAFALAHHPRLLIMDEPTDGLDPIFRREFLSLLQELVEIEQMGILFSTHITSDLDKVADYITLIDNGEVLLSMDKESLLNQYSIIKGSKELMEIIPDQNMIAVRRYKEGFEGMLRNHKEVQSIFKAEDNILLQRATLEDLMYYYCQRSRKNGSIKIV